jgi:hypothetical protein
MLAGSHSINRGERGLVGLAMIGQLHDRNSWVMKMGEKSRLQKANTTEPEKVAIRKNSIPWIGLATAKRIYQTIPKLCVTSATNSKTQVCSRLNYVAKGTVIR